MMVLRSKEPGSSPGSPTYQLCDLGQDTLSNPWVPHLQNENDNTTHPQRLNKTMHAKCLHYRQSAMFLGASLVAQLACNVGNLGSIPGLGRSPGEGKGNPFQCSGLGNSMDCIVHGFTKSRTRLSDFHFMFLEHLFFKTYSERIKIFNISKYPHSKNLMKLYSHQPEQYTNINQILAFYTMLTKFPRNSVEN